MVSRRATFVGAFVALAALAATAPVIADAPTPAEQRDEDEREGSGRGQDAGDSGYTEHVVVTASRVEEPALEAPVAITVVDERRIRTASGEDYGALLRGVPGLNGAQLGVRDLNFAARGASGAMTNRMLTLVDGRSVYMDHQGIVMFDGLSFGADEISQIEVIKGPGSAMWGANALAGVVNVRTKSPRELEGGKLTVGIGDRGRRSTSFHFADVGESVSYKLSARYLEQDPWPRDPNLPDGTPVPPEFRFENEPTEQPKVDVRVDHEAGGDAVWSYRAGFAEVNGTIISGLGPLSLRDDFYHAYGEVRRSVAGLDVSVYWNGFEGDTLNLLSGDVLTSESDTFVAEVTGRRSIGGRHRLVYGGNARHNSFDLSWAPGENSRSEVGAFLEDTISISQTVRVALGARVDHFDTIGTTVSPRTTLFVAPRWNHVLRLSYNRAYRAPTHIESFMDVTTVNPVVLDPSLPLFPLLVRGKGNPDLDEEFIDAFELGYTTILGGRHELAFAAYHNVIKDNIKFFTSDFYGPGDPPPGWPFPPFLVPPLPKEFTARNVGEVRDRGVELAWTAAWSRRTRTTASYTYQDEPRLTDDDPAAPVVLNTPPRHQAAFIVSVEGRRWFGAAEISYTDDAVWRDVLDQRFWGPTDSYTVVGGSIGVPLGGRVSFQVRASNVFDEDVKQHVFGDILGRQIATELRIAWR